jgi:hypothetical protein
MDRDKKLEKLNNLFQDWLPYSTLWNSAEATIIVKTKLEKVSHETRKKRIGPKDEDFVEYQYTEQWVEKIPPTDFVKIRYFSPKRDNFGSTDHESKEFPLEDIDRMLDHYENKVRNLKNKVDGN